VGREVIRHKTMVQLIGQTRKIIRTSPEHHSIKRVPVTSAELNQAEKILLDQKLRMAEELLHHAVCPSPKKQLKELNQRVRGILAETADQTPEAEDFSWVNELSQILCERFLDGQRQIEITAGPLELEIVPPLGPEDE
jgi:hypothetical protein